MRIPDRGSTTGPARWTEWPQAMTPAGLAKRVNPPLTAIFEKELVRKYGLFFAYGTRRGDENPRPGFDNGRSPFVNCRSLRLHGEWMTQAGFIDHMPVKIRVMRDCIVITPQHTRELFD